MNFTRKFAAPQQKLPRAEPGCWKRRRAIARAAATGLPSIFAQTRRKKETADIKVLIKSAWGSDDPTKAAFAFLHANAFAEAGHEVRIFLLGEAVNLMKDEVIAAVTPVGWPPLSEIVPETVGHRIPLNI